VVHTDARGVTSRATRPFACSRNSSMSLTVTVTVAELGRVNTTGAAGR
jgi:hypothetical protein